MPYHEILKTQHHSACVVRVRRNTSAVHVARAVADDIVLPQVEPAVDT